MLEVLVELLSMASTALLHLFELLFPVELLFCWGGNALGSGGVKSVVLVHKLLHGIVATGQSVINRHVGPAPLIINPLIS